MNKSIRSEPTQRLVQKMILQRAICTSNKKIIETKVVGSLVSWNGNAQTAVGSTRKKASVASANNSYSSPYYYYAHDDDEEEEEFPMKLSHFMQQRTSAPSRSLQEKWAKLASSFIEQEGEVSETTTATTRQQQAPLPQTLTDCMSDSRPCIIACMEDFTIVNVNPAWCAAYGYTKDEVLNQKILPLLGGSNSSSQDLKDYILEQLLNGDSMAPPPRPVLHYYGKDGTTTPMEEEKLRVGSLSIGADVSDRYLVCVTEMAAPKNTSSSGGEQHPKMITSLEDHGAWGHVAMV